MNRYDDFGKLLLRLALGVLIVLHGVNKIHSGVDSIDRMLLAQGLPAAMAYLVYLGEIVAPLLLLAGFFTRAAAVMVAINMLFAIGLAHVKDLTTMTSQGGWKLELQAMYLLTAVAIALLGAGRYGLGGAQGKYN